MIKLATKRNKFLLKSFTFNKRPDKSGLSLTGFKLFTPLEKAYPIRVSSLMKFILFIIISLSVTSCAYMSYLEDPFKNIPAFYKVNDNLYRGGRPDLSGLMQLQELKVKTIVNFQKDTDDIQNERQISQAFGFKFYNIPLSADKAPTDEQVIEFLDIVINEENFPVFVHCESGRDRTGAMIAMYRVVVDDWTIKEAYKEAKSLGFWPYHGDAELKRFIHQLKDKEIYFRKVGKQPPLP